MRVTVLRSVGARAWASRVTRRLEGAKAAFDLALGLRGGCHEMGHAEPAPGALEFAFGIAVIVAGTGAEEAQAVGVIDLGQAPGFEGLAEVLAVVPGRVRFDEAAGEVEAGMVIDGAQEGRLGGGRPPRVDGTVVLPKFAAGGRDGSGDRRGAGVPEKARDGRSGP